MERLTKKYNKYGKPYCFNCEEEVRFDNDIVKQTLYKLGQLEDLEEELGCPLEVVFKAIKNGIWFTNKDDELEYIDEALCFNTKRDSGKFIFDNYGYHCKNIEKMKWDEIYLEDYKKTWWLRKDKSE